MSRGFISPITVITGTANNMTGTTVLTSRVLDLRLLTAAAYFLSWTGTAVGTVSVQGSLDYNPVSAAGTWSDMGIVISNPPNGSADVAIIDLGRTGVPWLKLVYTNASGTGTLTVTASAKGV